MVLRNKNIIRVKFPRVYEYSHLRSGIYYLVDARRKKWGFDERKTFPTKSLAIKHAEKIEEQFLKFGAQVDVPKEKMVLADRFQGLADKLADFGKAPEDAVAHYVQILTSEAMKQAKPFVSKLVDEWLIYKRADTTLSHQYLIEMKSISKAFKQKWGNCKPDEIKKNDVELYLKGMKVSNTTRRKHRIVIAMFFKWVGNLTQTNTGSYTVLITNPYGSVTSGIANVFMSPSLTSPFSGAVGLWGQDINLGVGAIGTGAGHQ
jgi:hypothetical protein